MTGKRTPTGWARLTNQRKFKLAAAFLLAAVGAGACGEITAPPSSQQPLDVAFKIEPLADGISPTANMLKPLNGATGVPSNMRIVLQFSERMNTGTINASTFTLTPAGGSPIPGVIGFHGQNKVSFDAASPFAAGTTYTVTVTSGATDASGTPLTPPFTASFTTAGSVDVTAPTVTNVTPSNAASNVAVNSDVVVTFSEPMAGATVNGTTLTLTPTSGGSPIPAVVTYSAGSATLNPSANLANSTSYTVNVSNGATDVAGNGLTPFSSTFTTAAATDLTSPTVTNVTPSNAASNVAVNSDVVVTFSEPMAGATVNGTTFTLTPTSGGSPVPAVVTYSAGSATLNPSANLANSTSYTVNVSNGATDVAGNGLTPFSSTFTTAAAVDVTSPTVTNVTPSNSAANVPVNSNVVVTFSEAMTGATVNTSTFTLTPTSGGSPVSATVNYSAGQATLNPAADLAFATSYSVSVTSGAQDLANNGLTPFASSFTTAAAPDLTPPTVNSVSPVNAATNVALGANVVVGFSEAMAGATVNGTTFTLTPTSGGSPVPAVVTYSAGSATLNPSANLANSTSYTVNVSNGATDVAGNGLTPFSSTFTTAAPGDGTPPTVAMLAPVNGATGVSTTMRIVLQFSELMNLGTINNSTFLVAPSGGSPVPGFIDFHGSNMVSFDVSSPMTGGTVYTVTMTTGAQDVSGAPLASNFVASFTTVGAVDGTPPTVTNVSPVNAATNVAIASNIVVTFSEPMTAGTVNTTTFTLTPTSGGSPVPATVNYSAGSATLNPSSDLAYSTSYTVNVTNGAKDLANNGLTAFSSTFTTAAAPDLTPPTVTNVSPVNAATNVAIASNIVVTFSEPMTAGTVNTTTFTLTPTSGGSPVPATVNYSAGSATLNPSSDLAYSTSYTVNVTNGAKDLANNGLTPFSSTFTTAANPDVTSPTVTQVSPVNSATNVAIGANVVVTFSEAMTAATITTATFTLTPTSGGSPVAAVVSYSAGNATLNPSGNLANGTSYTVNVTSGATDLANNGLVPFSSTFTTIPPDVTAPTITSVTPANRSWDNSATAQVRVTFNEPINPATINTTTFRVQEVLPTGAFIAGTRTYDAATNTIVFTPSAAYKNHLSYRVLISTGITDVAGNALGSSFLSCFTPVAGVGSAMSMNGVWAGNNACDEVHWHLRIIQTGDNLSLAACSVAGDIECESSAVSQAGVQILGGEATCTPSPFGPPRICDLTITSLTGTVSGATVNFTMGFENGLSFTFNGSRSQTGTANPYFTGWITGATLVPIGMNMQREKL